MLRASFKEYGMFVRKEYRARAVGVLAAYAVLIVGVVATNAMDLAPAQPSEGTLSAAYAPDECAQTLRDRSDTMCRVC